MVAVNDRVNVWSERARRYREGTVKSPRSNGYWLLEYENGEMATKAVNDWDVIAPTPVATQPVASEYEKTIEETFITLINNEELVEFGNDELAATRFALRALRLGQTAKVGVRKLVESLSFVDPE